MATVCVLQHTVSEPPGTIVDALRASGHTLEIVRTFEGEPVPPDPDAMDGLIAMGGPMGAYEEVRYPFLRDEMQLMEKTLGAGKPVLGVCLGSQLLARVLGAAIRRGKRKEIGWYGVQLSDAGRRDILFPVSIRVSRPSIGMATFSICRMVRPVWLRRKPRHAKPFVTAH